MNERIYYSTETAQQAKRERFQLATLAMLVGTGLGAILTLLFSPVSGEKVRNQLENAVEDSKEQIEDGVEQAQRFVS